MGCGMIGGPVIAALQQRQAGLWSLAAVLARSVRQVGDLQTTTNPETFFAQPADLIIDLAGPGALASFGERMLATAECWTVNAAALADVTLVERLHTAGRQNGHRLRVLTGAIGGLDGVAVASIDDDAEVLVSIDIAPSEQPRECLYSGTAAGAAKRYPEQVNVAVAAALAGPGIKKTSVEVHRPNLAEGREMRLSARGDHGTFKSVSAPRVVPGKIHTVASCVIAALRERDKTIWVG